MRSFPSRSTVFIVLFISLLVVPIALAQQIKQAAAANAGGQKPEPPRKDLYDDPLPCGAIMRLGTLRLRFDGKRTSIPHQLKFSSDQSKILATVYGSVIIGWDVHSGKRLSPVKLPLPKPSKMAAWHPRYDQIAIANEEGIAVWDITARRRLHQIALSKVKCIRITPEGKAVFAGRDDGSVTRWDLATGKTKTVAVHKTAVEAVRGASATRVVSTARFKSKLTDFGDGKSTQLEYSGWRNSNPPHTISPDGRTVAFITNRKDKANKYHGGIELVDLKTSKTRRRLELKSPGWPDAGIMSQAAFAPDGKTLVSGHVDGKLRFWDVATGKVVRTLSGISSRLDQLHFSQDGSLIVASGVGNAVCLFDVKTGRRLHAHPAHEANVIGVAVAPNGKWLATASALDGAPAMAPHNSSVCIWRRDTGKLMHKIPHEFITTGGGVKVLPDNKTFVTASIDGALRWYDAATGKLLRQIQTLKDHQISFMEISADGSTIVVVNLPRTGMRDRSNHFTFSEWDAKTGKLRRKQKVTLASSFNTGVDYSPDGKLLAAGHFDWGTYMSGIAIVDTKNGRVIRDIPQTLYDAHRFSPNGRFLAIGHRGSTEVVDVQTAKSLVTMQCGPWVTSCRFSPDERVLAVTQYDSQFFVFELATGQPRLTRNVDSAVAVSTATFTPDGDYLITGNADSTALVWDLWNLEGAKRRANSPLTRKNLADLWQALANPDAQKAFRAMRALRHHPKQAVEMFSQSLRPAQPVTKKQLKKWIGQLSSETFRLREKAQAELLRADWLAKPALQAALERPGSLEAFMRLKRILARVNRHYPVPVDQLRSLRALELLERINSRETRQVVARLANGAAEARLTQQAKESLRRIKLRVN